MANEQSTFIGKLWEAGAGRRITNLRRLKLFGNKISYSLKIIGPEVNFEDFVVLELIRDISPRLYEEIFRHGEYFYDPRLAFETWGQQLHPLNDEEARKERKRFYDELKSALPADSQYAFSLLALIFPVYAEAVGGLSWGQRDEGTFEQERRICHPRFFRQYFLFRVPPELFSEKDFSAFRSSLENADEESARRAFNEAFSKIREEEFKRWHFMHRIDLAFGEFTVAASRGVSRGMANNSSHWQRAALEFDIGVRCTYRTLLKISTGTERQSFLREIISDSTSSLYTVYIIWIIETNKDTDRSVLPDVEAVKTDVEKWMAARYLTPNPPSVYDEFEGIDPNQALFGWRRLSSQAEADQRQYLIKLLATSPESLNKFLNLLFRPMMNDYDVLRVLFDYDELAKLISANEPKLDPDKVKQFWETYNREKASPPSLGEQQ